MMSAQQTNLLRAAAVYLQNNVIFYSEVYYYVYIWDLLTILNFLWLCTVTILYIGVYGNHINLRRPFEAPRTYICIYMHRNKEPIMN